MKIEYALKENIFNLKEPENYRCIFSGYASGHSIAWITIHPFGKFSERTHLYFDPVWLVNIPASWEGANFCLAEENDTRTLLDQLGILSLDFEDEFMVRGILDNYKLYFVNTYRGYQGKILANEASLHDSPPKRFLKQNRP